MTERERWVVYPLLFLALGASLRDKLGGRLTAKSIVCQELRIEDEPIGNQPAQVLAMIGRLQTSGTTPALGGLIVNGEVVVDGAVNVDGVVNVSKYYAFRNFPLFPNFQSAPRAAAPLPAAPTPSPPAPAANRQPPESEAENGARPSAARETDGGPQPRN